MAAPSSSSASTPASASSPFKTRAVSLNVLSVEQGEGMGARVRRSIGNSQLRNLDPFLMLDEFKVGRPAGFPDHPHRGFSTVTYVLPASQGSMAHEDFVGHAGVVAPGAVQWMDAARGIVHSEVPTDEQQAHGLQLWVNLRRKDKLGEPRYQELPAEEIPKVSKDGVSARVIAGAALGVESPVFTKTPTHYIHFSMEPNSTLQQPIPDGWASFVYTLSGKATFAGTEADAHRTLVLAKEGDGIEVQTGDDSAVDFVVISGEPIGEPIVQHGPVVMNTRQEIFDFINDYQQGRNGFEKAPGWSSKIGAEIM